MIPIAIHLWALALCAAGAWSQEAETPTPIEFLQRHDARVKAILARAPDDSLSPALRDSIKAHISAAFDFAELSRLALGAHWEERTPQEREHFAATFSGIIEEQNFDNFLRYYREGDITYERQEISGDEATVEATVPLERDEVEIVYRLHKVDGQWRVYDLSIDGVSTAAGNRRRYARYIAKHSYEKLIQQLDGQLQRLRARD